MQTIFLTIVRKFLQLGYKCWPKHFDSILLLETNRQPQSGNNLLGEVNAIGNTFFFFFVSLFRETKNEKQIQAHIFH